MARMKLGYFLDYATFQPTLVAAAVNSAISNLVQTLVIVLVVVVMFLGVRTGLIVGAFVPLTMLLGLVGMSVMDVELQRHRSRSFDEMEQWGDDLSSFDLVVALSPASQRRALELTQFLEVFGGLTGSGFYRVL